MKSSKLVLVFANTNIFNLILKACGSGDGMMVSQFIPPSVYQTTGNVPFFSHFILRIKQGDEIALELQAGLPEHDFVQSFHIPYLCKTDKRYPDRWIFLASKHAQWYAGIAKSVNWVLRMMSITNIKLSFQPDTTMVRVQSDGNITLNLNGEHFPMRKISDDPEHGSEMPLKIPDNGWYITAESVGNIDRVAVHMSDGGGSLKVSVNGNDVLKDFHKMNIHMVSRNTITETRCYELVYLTRKETPLRLRMFNSELGNSLVMICRDRELVTYLALGKSYVQLEKDDSRKRKRGQMASGKNDVTKLYQELGKHKHANILPKADTELGAVPRKYLIASPSVDTRLGNKEVTERALSNITADRRDPLQSDYEIDLNRWLREDADEFLNMFPEASSEVNALKGGSELYKTVIPAPGQMPSTRQQVPGMYKGQGSLRTIQTDALGNKEWNGRLFSCIPAGGAVQDVKNDKHKNEDLDRWIREEGDEFLKIFGE